MHLIQDLISAQVSLLYDRIMSDVNDQIKQVWTHMESLNDSLQRKIITHETEDSINDDRRELEIKVQAIENMNQLLMDNQQATKEEIQELKENLKYFDQNLTIRSDKIRCDVIESVNKNLRDKIKNQWKVIEDQMQKIDEIKLYITKH
ncbi:hypothetical protein pb186bvf_016357 [Paramecium bursaria]